MKIERNNHLLTLAVYVFWTGFALIAATLGLLNIKLVIEWIRHIVWAFLALLAPLIYGIIIAYLLDPIVKFYDKRCIRLQDFKWHFAFKHKEETKERLPMRTWATLFSFITVLLVVALFVLMIVLNVQDMMGSTNLTGLKISFYKYIQYFEAMLTKVEVSFASVPGIGQQGHLLQKVYGYFNHFFMRISRHLFRSLTVVGVHTMNWLLATVIAFYLLQDKARALLFLKKLTFSICKQKVYRHVEILAKDIDYVFSGYIRGQILDAIIIAVLTSVVLTIIRLEFAIIIGVIAGIFNLIPYFGPVIGFVLAGLIGIMAPNPMKAVYGVAAMLIIQQIDGWVIVPKVVGECVKLHPVVVLLAILIGGNLFGLIGMLIGVPIAGFIRLLLLRYMTEIFPDGETALKNEEAAQEESEKS
ncbi:AI-2E family transporter [Cellulosilyticum ruminicola]|uniref:AI-2E family transporter n=1 Tax=Cellulosilyticum ruminicola TaxID=425254 RepID=UPI0006CFF7FE|nr:AI-2E family transporter [Cellulosilyticum ruminicola]